MFGVGVQTPSYTGPTYSVPNNTSSGSSSMFGVRPALPNYTAYSLPRESYNMASPIEPVSRPTGAAGAGYNITGDATVNDVFSALNFSADLAGKVANIFSPTPTATTSTNPAPSTAQSAGIPWLTIAGIGAGVVGLSFLIGAAVK